MVNKNPYLRQNLRLAPIQKLTLTPALLQKIELLTLSHLELSEFIKDELLQNPLLEEGSFETAESPSDGEAPAEQAAAPETQPGTEAEAETGSPVAEDLDYGTFFEEYLDPGYRSAEYEEYERPEFDTFAVKPVSLYEHLQWQVGLVDLPPPVERAAREIIGNLDGDGYFTGRLEEIAEAAGTTPEEAAVGLEVVQRFDPAGVGARNLRDCLLLQLRYWSLEQSLAYRLLERHAELVEAGRMEEISRLEGVGLDEVRDALERIRRLNPRPGLQYEPDHTIYIQPDVYIYKVGHDYLISLNEDGLPKLHINPYYRRILESGKSTGSERKFIREKFKNAVELIRNLDHRKRTIYRVCEIIVTRQREVLDQGFAFLKPMLLKDVADELGLHTSTVSRAVTNKWVHCPQGILELRQFFTLGFKTDTGEDISIHILKAKLRELIEKENPAKPLSDHDLTDMLNRQGVEIKRRTVAKYREEMEIPNSRSRRAKN
jgi:RNA polymerase sigma-54 factor